MTILAFILAITAIIGWLAAVGTLLYGIITKHSLVGEMFVALIIVTITAAAACTGAAALLGYRQN